MAPLASSSLDAAMVQVGKTQLGKPVDAGQVDLIIATIAERLALSPNDTLLDLGCGNGLLTERLSHLVERVDGIDLSPVLIEDARRYRQPSNVTYHTGDMASLLLPLDPARPVKITSYEVIQHLKPEEMEHFLRGLRDRAQGPVHFFGGSIPDRERIRHFYNTPERWELYQQNVAAGKEQIGTWWVPGEFAALAEHCGFTCTILAQNPLLYTSHYRFDALLGAIRNV